MRGKIKRTLAVLLVALGLVAAGAVPAYATVYHGCPTGQACVWTDKDGGGVRLAIAVGAYGYNTCWSYAGTSGDNVVSSASADFGGGWDLRLFNNNNCTSNEVNRFDVESSEFVNFTGANWWFNDSMTSFKIMQT